MRLRLCTLGLLAVAVWIAPTPAQEPAAPSGQSGSPSFRTSADLVTIDAVVTDGDGRHVTDLTPAEFEVTVGGKRQDLQQSVYIRTVIQSHRFGAARALNTPQPDRPASQPPQRSRASLALKNTPLAPERVSRTIALVVDDLGLSFRSTVDVRKALKRYIDTQMAPGDLVAIVRTAGGVGTLQQFTTDRRLLHLAADRVQWDFRSRHGVGFFKVSTPGMGVGDVDAGPVGEIRDAMASVGSPRCAPSRLPASWHSAPICPPARTRWKSSYAGKIGGNSSAANGSISRCSGNRG